MKKILLLSFIFIFAFGIKAQNLAFYFELIPEAQLPHLRADMRKGMVGMYELGQRPARVPNTFNGICVLDTLSNDYLSMHTSDVSLLTIKMMENKADTSNILVVLHTVKAAGTLDSSINFFTSTWSKLNGATFFTVPTANDFYLENDKITIEDFSRFCMPLMISYEIDNDTLKAKIDPEKYLPKEVFEKIQPGLKSDPLIYQWNGIQYEKQRFAE